MLHEGWKKLNCNGFCKGGGLWLFKVRFFGIETYELLWMKYSPSNESWCTSFWCSVLKWLEWAINLLPEGGPSAENLIYCSWKIKFIAVGSLWKKLHYALLQLHTKGLSENSPWWKVSEAARVFLFFCIGFEEKEKKFFNVQNVTIHLCWFSFVYFRLSTVSSMKTPFYAFVQNFDDFAYWVVN